LDEWQHGQLLRILSTSLALSVRITNA
jgi:hypothetical protein